MALCPMCEEEMRTVSARANPGTLIILDQCLKCGGIWCDQWELYPIDCEEASRLDPVVAAATSDPKYWVSTGTGGIFAYPRGETEDGLSAANSVKGIAWITLQTVLRLLLRI